MATKDISDLQCCQAAAMQGQPHNRTGDYLMQMTGQPEKVCHRAIERAISRGYLDCGLGAWWAWLEPKGRELLEQSKQEAKDAESREADELRWPQPSTTTQTED